MTTTWQTNEIDFGDAKSLLQYDPGLVVLLNNENDKILDELQNFASKLSHYVEIAKDTRQQLLDTSNNTAVPVPDAAAADVNQQQEREQQQVDQQDEDEEGGDDVVPRGGNACAQSSEDRVNEEEGGSGGAKDDVEPSLKRQRLVEIKTRRSMRSSTTKALLEPPNGYKGTLEESQLERSVGLTRYTLNQHLKDLGLTAKFDQQQVISKNTCCSSTSSRSISHLTLNPKWDELPYSRNQKLQWWLGEGCIQRNLALDLSPQLRPHQPAIAIFWAEEPPQLECSSSRGGEVGGGGVVEGGGTLCHYVGHFRCKSFEEKDINVVRKGKRRQALLEFKFVEFQQEMSEKLDKIASAAAAANHHFGSFSSGRSRTAKRRFECEGF